MILPPVDRQKTKPSRTLTLAGLTLILLATTGCSLFLRATPTPIPTQKIQTFSTVKASTLIVCLPGRGGAMADFERAGFLAILKETGVNADLLIADAHLGYYANRTIIERLYADVLLPARQQGYRRIVLVGVSLGGLGALFCERDHPGSADTLVLLGPFLGDNTRLFKEIDSAGSPSAWAVGRDPLIGKVETQIWTFLGTRSANLPPTWLLCGKDDSLGQGHRLFATLLPPARIRLINGAHDWPTWRALWKDVCQNSDLFSAEKASLTPTNAPTTKTTP